jgi:serine/threonine protein phosphatase PrpC
VIDVKTVLRSHVGKVRQANEDQAWSGRLLSGHTVAIVADGMGGHRAGDVASGLAVDSLVQSLKTWEQPPSVKEGATRLRDVIRKANTVVYETATLNEQYHNMGTTVVVALFDGEASLIGHIGDSRAYRVREGQLEQLTEDHTLVNELTRTGQLSPEEAAHHPRRNVLTRALGTDREVEVDIQIIDLKIGDRILLCSDGLSGLVEPQQLLETLVEPDLTLDQQAQKLIDLALAAGGDDNVTVVLVANDDKAGASGGESA